MIKFIVEGECVPKARPRVKRNGYTFTPKKTKDYEENVKFAIYTSTSDTFPLYDEKTPLRAEIIITLGIPTSWTKKKQEQARNGEIMPCKRGDLDNYAKAILDACNGIVFFDDGDIVELYVEKKYGVHPQADVTIMSMDEKERRKK